ncbi:MAG: gas vesicle accessory protein GvpU [Bacillota bacterium]
MSNKQPELPATDDAVVLMFLSLVDEEGVEVAVTLNVNGVVVSGSLIGAKDYYAGITEASKELQDHTLSKIIAKKFTDLKEAYSKQRQEQDDKEDKQNSPTFIHLKNATYLNADGQPITSKSGTWWRGRISSIDGFSFNFLN